MDTKQEIKDETSETSIETPSNNTSNPIKEEEINEPEILVTKIESLKTLGPFLVQQDNTQNVLYASDIPQICKDEPCMLGVDEAGRGPVLGPMVYGIAFCPLDKSEILTALGCADSKQLTEEKREIIFDEMHSKEYAKENIGWAVEVISPNFISMNMLKRSKTSLNEVSMNSAIGLIQKAIDLGVNIAEVYVDTVGPPEKYQEKLSKIFPDFQITVAKKADSTYPIVSAASICAKVSRDHAIKVWKFREGLKVEKFGSGYPGDPVTKAFLQDNIDPVFGFPRLVRFSWSTADKILQQKSYFVEFDDVDDDSVPKKKAKNPITTFFKTGGKRTRHGFFKTRFLQNVEEF